MIGPLIPSSHKKKNTNDFNATEHSVWPGSSTSTEKFRYLKQFLLTNIIDDSPTSAPSPPPPPTPCEKKVNGLILFI